MRFVERLEAGVRFRLVAERPTIDFYCNREISKLARLIPTFACTGANRRTSVVQVKQSISRMCAITHRRSLVTDILCRTISTQRLAEICRGPQRNRKLG